MNVTVSMPSVSVGVSTPQPKTNAETQVIETGSSTYLFLDPDRDGHVIIQEVS